MGYLPHPRWAPELGLCFGRSYSAPPVPACGPVYCQHRHAGVISLRVKIKRRECRRISPPDPFEPVFPLITIEFELVPFGVKKVDAFGDEVVNGGGNSHVVSFQLSVAFLKRGKV